MREDVYDVVSVIAWWGSLVVVEVRVGEGSLITFVNGGH
jgi:hypothetical protein